MMKSRSANLQFRLIQCSLFFLFSLNSYSQIEFYYGVTEEIYEINQDTDPNILRAFLLEIEATDIEFNPNPTSSYPFRAKNKKGNWMLYTDQWSDDQFIMTRKAQRYSFQFPNAAEERILMTWARRHGYSYWVNLESERIEKKMAFNDVKVTTGKVKQHLDDLEFEVDIIEKIAVKAGDKWGLIEPGGYTGDAFYVSRNFLHNSPDEVPPATRFDIGQLQMLETIRSYFFVDQLEALDDFGYYLKGRKQKEKHYGFFLSWLYLFEPKNQTEDLYGLFVGEGKVYQTIPIEYSDIKSHHNPEEVFEVWKDGKVGYYNSDYELIIEPIYDEFHFMHLDNNAGCALKKEGFWQLFDAFDGSLVVEGKAKTIEELQDFWLNGPGT